MHKDAWARPSLVGLLFLTYFQCPMAWSAPSWRRGPLGDNDRSSVPVTFPPLAGTNPTGHSCRFLAAPWTDAAKCKPSLGAGRAGIVISSTWGRWERSGNGRNDRLADVGPRFSDGTRTFGDDFVAIR